jgi:hypothetical protein
VSELERAVSCRRADPWWRTKLDFGGSEPFDDLHWSSTLGTAIKIGKVFGGRTAGLKGSDIGHEALVGYATRHLGCFRGYP